MLQEVLSFFTAHLPSRPLALLVFCGFTAIDPLFTMPDEEVLVGVPWCRRQMMRSSRGCLDVKGPCMIRLSQLLDHHPPGGEVVSSWRQKVQELDVEQSKAGDHLSWFGVPVFMERRRENGSMGTNEQVMR
jgi:hypothetical protein